MSECGRTDCEVTQHHFSHMTCNNEEHHGQHVWSNELTVLYGPYLCTGVPETFAFTVGIGSTVTMANRDRTLKELEQDIAKARELGAPDDATVVKTAPGSTYVGEILWVGP